MNSLSTNF